MSDMSHGNALLAKPTPTASAVVLDDYAPGAAFTTDLVNTVAGPHVRDTLSGVDDLRSLLERYGGDAGAAERDVGEVRAVRARLLEVFGARDADGAVAQLNALAASPGRHAVSLLQVAPGGAWTWSATFADDSSLAERVQVVSSLSLLGVVKSLGFARLRSCQAPDCSGVFADTSRAGRRKYCQPSICGNRQNVAAYRARRAHQGSSE
jgi:predicted RNA-binding Zn ribbon-like protein